MVDKILHTKKVMTEQCKPWNWSEQYNMNPDKTNGNKDEQNIILL